MLQKVSTIPSRFYQVALLNIGLIIAISKEMPLLSILSSLIFVALLVAPIGIYFGIISPPPHQIIHEQISSKLKGYQSDFTTYLKQWEGLEQQKKTKTIITVLFALYVSINFMCPCVETFLFVNVAFVYLFMHEEFEYAERFICNLCQGKCPVAH